MSTPSDDRHGSNLGGQLYVGLVAPALLFFVVPALSAKVEFGAATRIPRLAGSFALEALEMGALAAVLGAACYGVIATVEVCRGLDRMPVAVAIGLGVGVLLGLLVRVIFEAEVFVTWPTLAALWGVVVSVYLVALARAFGRRRRR